MNRREKKQATEAKTPAKSTRKQIVEAADQLFYQQGFVNTSFAHIAGVVRISRGNFYYHFKTKDEILDAVIDARLGNTRNMLAGWEVDAETPAARIRSFIHILIRNRDKITGFGCPVGTLTAELSKSGHAAGPDAAMIFTLFHIWLRRQFQNLGHRADADRLAMELLLRSQGAAVLASAFGDESILQHAVTDMCGMLDNLTDENRQTSDITEGKPVL